MTPTSANTAHHMLAMPTAPSSRNSPLTVSAKTMFSYTIRIHLRAIRMARLTLAGSSSISTTSAASMAASDPSAPMAMPTSARVSTGASLMPSPTKARLPLPVRAAISASTRSTLSPGSSSAWYSSIPSWPATPRATASLSPVSITVRTPWRRRAAMASAAWSLSSSAIRMDPQNAPSRATYTTVPMPSSGV